MRSLGIREHSLVALLFFFNNDFSVCIFHVCCCYFRYLFHLYYLILCCFDWKTNYFTEVLCPRFINWLIWLINFCFQHATFPVPVPVHLFPSTQFHLLQTTHFRNNSHYLDGVKNWFLEVCNTLLRYFVLSLKAWHQRLN